MLICVGPGRKPKLLVFSRKGSYYSICLPSLLRDEEALQWYHRYSIAICKLKYSPTCLKRMAQGQAKIAFARSYTSYQCKIKAVHRPNISNAIKCTAIGCMVRPCVRDDKPRAVSEWLSFVHTDEPYNKLLIALLAPCTLCISGYLTSNT